MQFWIPTPVHAPTDVVTIPALEYFAFSVLEPPFGGSGTSKSSLKSLLRIWHCSRSSLNPSASASFSLSRLSLL